MLNLKQIIILVLSFSTALNANTLSEITSAIEKICKAPSDEKSSYYKIVAKGKSNLDVKFIDIDGDVNFTKEEWEGARDVLREDQAKDNQNYRRCSTELARLLIPKVIVKKDDKKNETKDNTPKAINNTHIEKSPIIINPQSPTIINYNGN